LAVLDRGTTPLSVQHPASGYRRRAGLLGMPSAIALKFPAFRAYAGPARTLLARKKFYFSAGT
jgi:hypothetical protein